jgi:hypothetical protein
MAKVRIGKLRSVVGRISEQLSRKRLKAEIAEARDGLINFMRKTGKGRIFVDHKHLTLGSGRGQMQVPLTSTLRYSLEELAPIGDSLSRLGRGALVCGKYESNGREILLEIGERTVKDGEIRFTERMYRI